MSIACIEEEDIEYFESEVRNGNVSKFFGNEEKALKGSNQKLDDFEIVRGHRKFILAMRDILKAHMNEHGPDSFTLEVQKEKPTDENISRKRKVSSNDSRAKAKKTI